MLGPAYALARMDTQGGRSGTNKVPSIAIVQEREKKKKEEEAKPPPIENNITDAIAFLVSRLNRTIQHPRNAPSVWLSELTIKKMHPDQNKSEFRLQY